MEGLDFYRALQDLSDHFRQKLVTELNEADNDSYPEQIVRILDALRDGDELVRLGLSEKTNFEVTLFRAVESGKSRSIDQVIRRISKVLPAEDFKKKTEFPKISQSKALIHSPDLKKGLHPAPTETGSIVGFEKSALIPVIADEPEEKKLAEPVANQNKRKGNRGTDSQEIRQIQDQAEISKKVNQLPEELRKSLLEDYKVNFVSIEKIDPSQLI